MTSTDRAADRSARTADAAGSGEAQTQALDAVAALRDGVRRRLYRYVRGRSEPVSRDEAAGDVGISPRLAAFHLDKLVRTGLLRAHYARKRGRAGPGAGRSSKFYQPAATEFAVSIPERRYDVVGAILVEAIRSCDAAVAGALRRAAEQVARIHGERLGRDERGTRRRPGRGMAAVARVLAGCGFEPRRDRAGAGVAAGLMLANCPFESLAAADPELVCAVNRALVEGVLAGVGDREATAVLRPEPGRCCVQVVRSAGLTGAGTHSTLAVPAPRR